MANFDDIIEFHDKLDPFQLACPGLIPQDQAMRRFAFMVEELQETMLAYSQGDLVSVADGLIDLVYVAMGMAYKLNLPWQELWEEVHAANISKEVGPGKRGKRDIIKPDGWVGPNIRKILADCQHLNKPHCPLCGSKNFCVDSTAGEFKHDLFLRAGRVHNVNSKHVMWCADCKRTTDANELGIIHTPEMRRSREWKTVGGVLRDEP